LSEQSSFLLTKWYVDCVAENGDAVIAYVAALRWNELVIQYGSSLVLLGGNVHCKSSIRTCSTPRVSDKEITVSLPHLGLEGIWRALAASAKLTIFESEQGAIHWHCLQPMSQVDLLLQGKREITGLGYAECLTLSLLPWQLPIEELYWGRFLSEQDAVVWIDWRGPYRKRVVLHNGGERQVESLTESKIVFADRSTQLELDRGFVLREGQLGQTVLSRISRLAKVLPRNMMAVQECKWRSAGVLRTAATAVSGWAIHEVVKWKE
jgi:hypothetical protein